jgi:hypothetical protein
MAGLPGAATILIRENLLPSAWKRKWATVAKHRSNYWCRQNYARVRDDKGRHSQQNEKARKLEVLAGLDDWSYPVSVYLPSR